MSTDRTFYTKQSVTKTETGIKAELTFHAEHELYKGHFPGNPITPGVCLVQSINDLVEDHFDGAQIKKCVNVNLLQSTILMLFLMYSQ